MNRRQFLLTAVLAGASLLAGSQLRIPKLIVSQAATLRPEDIDGELKPLPYKPLDPEKVRVYAYKLYHRHLHCGAGAFGALVLASREAVGEPWTSIPIHALLWQKGGGIGYGSTCGALAGSAAFISLVLPEKQADEAINQLFRWYASHPFPQWTPPPSLVEEAGGKVKGPLPVSISYSILCHTSVTQWCLVSGKSSGSPERGERCARLTGEVAAKTAWLLNQVYETGRVPFLAPDPFTVNQEYGCRACHRKGADYEVGGWTRGKMNCVVCHQSPHLLPLSVRRRG